jgi:ribose transport system substrate-binding protein
MIPLDIDVYWKRDKKPPRYTVPAPYTEAVESGEMERVAQRYAAAYTTDPFASVRTKCRNGGKDILQ